MLTVKVKFLLDSVKKQQVVTISSGQTIGDLLKNLGIKDEDYYLFIVNGSNKPSSYVLQDGDTVELFPQMSGG